MGFGDVSTELCGGTHANATGEIGLLRITSESGIAAGVRRIEAVTGMGALAWIREREATLERAAALLKIAPGELPERIERMLDDRKEAQRKLDQLAGAQRGEAAVELLAGAVELDGGRLVAARVDGLEGKALSEMIDDLRARIGSGVVCIASESGGKALVAVGVTKDWTSRHKAGDLVREAAKIVGGGGGGRPDFAQAGGKDPSKIEAALDAIRERVGAR